MEIDDPMTGDDSEFEEEEYFLFVDIDPASLAEHQIRDSNLKIYGINTKKPLLQVNNQFFEGKCVQFSMPLQ